MVRYGYTLLLASTLQTALATPLTTSDATISKTSATRMESTAALPDAASAVASSTSRSPAAFGEAGTSSSRSLTRASLAAPVVLPTLQQKKGFAWRRALGESFVLLSIQHAVLAKTDSKWITAGGGVPFNHYWRDYRKSLHTWANTGWDDGDPFLDNYIAHPLQGALTGYIQVQNDPSGERLEFSNTREYWKSRLKATAWATAYSVQWEIGPISEMTVEKYGTWDPWLQNGKWINGVGQVDMVMTPVGGLGWMIMEDVLDKHVAKPFERNRGKGFWVGFVRCAVNPIRSGANILHGKAPWFRASRDEAGGSRVEPEP